MNKDTTTKPSGGSTVGMKLWCEKSVDELKSLPLKKLKEADPMRFRAVVELLDSGVSYKAIERATGIGNTTLAKIAREEPDLQKGIKVLSAKLHRVANQVADRLSEILDDEDEIKDISAKELMVCLCIAADKIHQHSHVATPSSVTQVNINAAPDLNQLIKDLPSGNKPIDV